MGFKVFPQTEPKVQTQTTPNHVLTGFDIEPPAIKGSVRQRLLEQLGKWNDYSAQMRRYNSGTFHANVNKTRTLSADIHSNGNKQAAAHFATALLEVAVGVAIAKAGGDVTSAITVTDKFGNGGVKVLDASGTFMSSDKQLVEHQISKNSDANQRISAFVKQGMEAVRSYEEMDKQQKSPL